jgi:hypothetical protein
LAFRKEECKTRTKANTSEAEKANALEKKTAAAKALNAAKLQVEEAKEERAKAVEKLFDFHGSYLSQSEQSLWEKIVTKHIFGKKREEASGKTKQTYSTIACRYICSPSLSSMLWSYRNSEGHYLSVSRPHPHPQ